MTAEGASSLEGFERHVRAMMEELVAAHPEIVARCKPGILTRRVEGDQVEAFMLDKNDGTPVVLGTFPTSWLTR